MKLTAAYFHRITNPDKEDDGRNTNLRLIEDWFRAEAGPQAQISAVEERPEQPRQQWEGFSWRRAYIAAVAPLGAQ